MTEEKGTKVNFARYLIFALLVLVGAGLMVYSWLQPWWTIDIEGFVKDAVQIHPWGLEMNQRMGGFEILLKGEEMPSWFPAFMWAYLGLAMLALLVGSFVRYKKVGFGKLKIKLSQFLVGGVGLSYIVVGVVAALFAQARAKATFDVPLQGRGFVDLGDPIVAYVDTRLLTGYWLIYVAAGILIVLALLHGVITGEK